MKIEENDAELVCTLEGQLDTPKSQQLEQLLKARLKASQAVTFDMHGVTYVCSAFLRVCVLAARTAAGGKLTLRGITPPIKRVFTIAGMSDLFQTE